MGEVFDGWPEKYEAWFQTPIGRLVWRYENDLVTEMLRPLPGEAILDAGCGTGVFTESLLAAGASVTGLEISLPMLATAREKLAEYRFRSVRGDMTALPFPDDTFDKVVSITAVEFVEDAGRAVGEAFRVTKPDGSIVVATLNRLSPWATQRKEAGMKGHRIFDHTTFRSPAEVAALSPVSGVTRTAIYFDRDEDPDRAQAIEEQGRSSGPSTGAFLVARWVKTAPATKS